nr:hypothetical protein BaRGS_032931 [Batillaria attramentaria]
MSLQNKLMGQLAFVLQETEVTYQQCYNYRRAGLANGNSEARVPVISITYAADDQPESEFGDAMLDHNLRDDEDDGLESRTLAYMSATGVEEEDGGEADTGHRYQELREADACGFLGEEPQRQEAEKEHEKASLREADLVLMMLNGYRDALVFEEDKGGSRLTRNTATAGRRPQNQHSRSFTHLHQFQQQLQQDRASFLSHTSLGHHHDDDFLPDVSDGRQTVYMVCSKSPKSPNREPRLVKWPPSPDTAENERRGEEEEEEGALDVGETLSDVFSDSPVSFRDLDLSVVINRRSAGTPDSDASTFF